MVRANLFFQKQRFWKSEYSLFGQISWLLLKNNYASRGTFGNCYRFQVKSILGYVNIFHSNGNIFCPQIEVGARAHWREKQLSCFLSSFRRAKSSPQIQVNDSDSIGSMGSIESILFHWRALKPINYLGISNEIC